MFYRQFFVYDIKFALHFSLVFLIIIRILISNWKLYLDILASPRKDDDQRAKIGSKSGRSLILLKLFFAEIDTQICNVA